MFRFTIRDVLWLTVVVAVLVAWWLQWRGHVLARSRDARTIELLKSQARSDRVRIVPLFPNRTRTIPAGLRTIPAEWDYQVPPARPCGFTDPAQKFDPFDRP